METLLSRFLKMLADKEIPDAPHPRQTSSRGPWLMERAEEQEVPGAISFKGSLHAPR